MRVKTNDIFIENTHANLLNKLLRTTYKEWMKSRYLLKDYKTMIWMVEFNKKKNGYENKMIPIDTIIENYDPSIKTITRNTDKLDRLVFEIKKNGGNRIYIFKGLFKYCKEQSIIDKNVLVKISDTFDL